MVELKRCSGYKGHWKCSDEYPDHMVPTSRFGPHASQSDGFQDKCRRCRRYRNALTNPTDNPLRTISYRLAGGFKEYYSLPKKDKSFFRSEARKILQLKTSLPTLKFKSKKPKFNQGQYKSSPSTPRDSTKEVVPKEGPGYVYVMIDTLKMPGLIKIGTAENVGDRLQDGNTWGAFSCLYKKAFERSYEAESKVHELLDDCRVYSNKEWFSVDTDLAIKTIEDLYELS